MFEISEDLQSAKCPTGVASVSNRVLKNQKEMRINFPKETCNKCIYRKECIPAIECDKGCGRAIDVNIRYDAVSKRSILTRLLILEIALFTSKFYSL